MDTLLNLFEGDWLPYVFAFLLGLSLLIYICLDGYDLGLGILSFKANSSERDKMISSIAPFWDANETWLVLAAGLILVGFPLAHGIVFQHLYIPIAIMLIGLVLRGVSFDFRGKVPEEKKSRWDRLFGIGSLMAVLTQGYMLGVYLMGFQSGWQVTFFACFSAILAVAAVCLIGSNWLIMKTVGQLQYKAAQWSFYSIILFAVLQVMLFAATAFLSEPIRERWFGQGLTGFYVFPVLIGLVILAEVYFLYRNRQRPENRPWIPFVSTVLVFILNFVVLAITFYPWIVMDQINLVDSAASRDSLMIILVGTAITLPILIAYTVIVYRIFHGKVTELSYE